MAASQPFADEHVTDGQREKDRAERKHDEIQHRGIPPLQPAGFGLREIKFR
jgi:hypothetical protein